jgi:type II secretory pathway pseudopilin PulG
LIELLVVITIIGLLAAILIPSISAALKSAKRARAMSQVNDLEGAIKRYWSEYGKAPMPKTVKVGDADAEYTGAQQAQIIQILLNLDDGWGVEERNTKQIVFLDVDPVSFGVKTVVEMQAALERGEPYKDPWGDPKVLDDGHDYGILLDLNMDEKITGLSYGDIRAKSAVYSRGEGGKDNQDNPPYKTW